MFMKGYLISAGVFVVVIVVVKSSVYQVYEPLNIILILQKADPKMIHFLHASFP